MLKRNSINVHSNTGQLALRIWRLSKVSTCDFGNIFNGFRLKAHACFDRPEYRMSAVRIAKL